MKYLLLLLCACVAPQPQPKPEPKPEPFGVKDYGKMNQACCEICIKGGWDFGFVTDFEDITCTCFKKKGETPTFY